MRRWDMGDRDGNARASRYLLGIGFVLLGLGLALLWRELPRADIVSRAGEVLVAPGCRLGQSIVYERCGHTVLRRVDAPAEWAGRTREGVLEALEEGWRVTGFSGALIEMTCAPDMFCPQHWVLALGPDGAPGVWRNRLGFAMEHVSDANPGPLDEETRAALARGLPFDTREALDEWLRAR